MLGNRDSRGAKHRFLVLMYLSFFILSLAPTIVAPPEREFLQGQPETHQAMDNMVSHGILMKKTGPNFSASGAINYPALLTYKTSILLDEAEYALRTMQNSKEKQWVGAFVQQMRALAIMLERSAARSNPNLPMIPNSKSAIPVPEGLPAHLAWHAPPAVRAFNPFQRENKMMSKFHVTSPELSQLLPDNVPSERQVVTKPAMMSNNQTDVEDDELVRELQSLQKEVAAKVPASTSKVIISTPEFTSPATLVFRESEGANINNAISMYQHLGEIPKEVMNAVNGENNDPTGFRYMHKEEPIKSGVNKGMVDMLGREQLEDINNEEKRISKPYSESLVSERSHPYYGNKQIELKENHALPNTHLHPNLSAFPKLDNNFPYMSSQSKVQPHQRILEDAIANLQQPNLLNFHGNVRINQQQSHIPDALKQKMLRPENKIYNGHAAAPNYNEYMIKTKYRPYAYTQYWEHNNSTVNLPPDMSPSVMKPMVNHQIDTQLSDEMKRQLRDGKIVVLSDSVVRSNFQNNTGEKIAENEKNKLKIDINEKKSDPQSTN